MTDTMTQKPLRVSTDGTAGPYIMVSVGQLDAVRRLLDRNRIRFWVEEEVISLDGGPEIAVVDLGRGADSERVQELLDNAR